MSSQNMDKLKQYRLIQGYSQSKLANKLGVTQQCYQYYECGKRDLPINMAKRIAEVFDVDWWKLYE